MSTIDFTKPVPVPRLAAAAGIHPGRLQSLERRKRYGLVDAPTPLMGGRFSWVTGESAALFIKAVKAMNLALHS